MRPLLACAVLAFLVGGCVPEILVKPEFGTSALKPTGDLPPEFAAFNSYDTGINPLLARQMCATPYIPEVEHTAEAVPGEVVAATGWCQTYAPFFADLKR
jgi:hypothetical protein